jgi:hypothetical protein
LVVEVVAKGAFLWSESLSMGIHVGILSDPTFSKPNIESWKSA